MGFLKKLIPPDRWKLLVLLVLAIFTGLAVFSIYISNVPSYLSDKSETCINCHIMAPQYATWYEPSVMLNIILTRIKQKVSSTLYFHGRTGPLPRIWKNIMMRLNLQTGPIQ